MVSASLSAETTIDALGIAPADDNGISLRLSIVLQPKATSMQM
jgi:hypothetical protein